jgi:hypothetical protein
MARYGKSFVSGLAFALALAGPALAVERNPFLPPDLQARIGLADEARMLEVARRSIAVEADRLRAEIARDIGVAVRGSADVLRQEMERATRDLTVKIDEIGAAGVGTAGAGLQDGATTLPEGTTFLACVNGKALYRDANGTNFFIDANDPSGLAQACL